MRASIEPQGVTLVYLPLGVRETLPVASTLSVAAASRPAQVRWEGPARLGKGDAFTFKPIRPAIAAELKLHR